MVFVDINGNRQLGAVVQARDTCRRPVQRRDTWQPRRASLTWSRGAVAACRVGGARAAGCGAGARAPQAALPGREEPCPAQACALRAAAAGGVRR